MKWFARPQGGRRSGPLAESLVSGRSSRGTEPPASGDRARLGAGSALGLAGLGPRARGRLLLGFGLGLHACGKLLAPGVAVPFLVGLFRDLALHEKLRERTPPRPAPARPRPTS